jgi:hypothetical protein
MVSAAVLLYRGKKAEAVELVERLRGGRCPKVFCERLLNGAKVPLISCVSAVWEPVAPKARRQDALLMEWAAG